MSQDRIIKRALISVTDKTGIVDFAQTLHHEFGVELISTGGTAHVLVDAGIPVVSIENVTGFPEMMDGRVKTLHPKVHGALLARRDLDTHMSEALQHQIDLIDLVVVNLYEFEKTVASPDVSFADAIEHIDIGGPSMLRSAAKNADAVTVVMDPSDYATVLAEMRINQGATTAETRRHLQYKVFACTAQYDAAIAAWLERQLEKDNIRAHNQGLVEPAAATGASACSVSEHGVASFGASSSLAAWQVHPSETLSLTLTKQQDLRYGENPHQSAAFYRMPNAPTHALVNARQLQGKELSYNNLLDTDAAWNLVREFEEPACIILKHQNPCGSAVATNITDAYDRAFACDPKSAFGGIIACNREVPLELVEHIADVNKQFVEVLIAPSFSDQALERLSRRANLRVLATGGIDVAVALEFRSVDGGMLVQTVDRADEDVENFTVPTTRKPTETELSDLMFAWRVCKGVKSNAILIAKDGRGLGMGPGQPNRVDSARMACLRAEEACERSGLEKGNFICASDAFFPFRDNVDTLAEHGVVAIIQPGGSMRDDECIEACNERGIAMVFTGVRHFRH
ncbi:bifunctional phosphoribosylaminoimidazolecarboxamide formyltransferase/IMP cyclohydrolase [Collinsella sp. zg1085]|uniref:bifunctional phosphoribosylaminoimidazolecarboxamide formyltransferase/IMP cyclohydrolase n=1 Tax=Collinsella sp. zg1085 TaxID=2844380 RepID=UPI001C0AEA0E|nr:bifunctional phosphoribosylaminoimidazolecarboxamide formyltransferase/IMP cyclohydrolase [Collinsella sp. zg1085]QWT17985.1 bifunctional phosphoribosylaminoimidazolecarboxamide formyltransferase/IMP cyclohydrolase [Collinsella sp. zg1085]